MFSSQSAEISLDTPCRALAAVQADKVESRFLLGSCDQSPTNYLHVVRFHGEVNELGVDAKIVHNTGPVSVICCSPHDSSLVLTAAERSASVTLWKIPRSIMTQSEELQYDPEDDDALDVVASATMEELMTLTPEGLLGDIVDIVWRDSSEDLSSSSTGDVLTIDQQGRLTRWDVATGIALRNGRSPLSKFVGGLQPRVAFDPHTDGEAIAVTTGTSICLLDWRDKANTSIPLGMVESFVCHRYGVTGIDYNPNKPYVLASSGQDGLIKFWDLRSASRPLLVARGGHSHWAWTVKYNPFHDQLVLSAGTDSLANLWRLSTISSAPLLTAMASNNNDENDDNDNSSVVSETAAPNVRVARHEHGDSIYQANWSAADAWVYMIAGYDGKVVLNHVPSKEKYKILL
jgi:EARP and GARP complex-interacting protein 1